MTRALLGVGVAALLSGAACSGPPQPGTDEERALRGLGVQMGQGLAALELSSRERELVKAGFEDALDGKAAPLDSKTAAALKLLVTGRSARLTEKEAIRGAAFREKAAQEPGAVTFESGVVFRELAAGNGDAVTENSRVKVNFRGTLVDGSPIEDSVSRGKPVVFPMGSHVIPCWAEALVRMRAGGKARVVCPPSAAYGDYGRPQGVPPGATVVYELELVEVGQ
jgi:FKBP-type peptidyl-prolyl cis-trans isomerase FkpA